MRSLTDWKYRKVFSTSDIPGYGSAKKLGEKIFEGLKILDIALERGTRLVQEQIPYDEYSYEVYLDGDTLEPVTHRFNFRDEGSGWHPVGPIQIENSLRICAGGGSLCTQ